MAAPNPSSLPVASAPTEPPKSTPFTLQQLTQFDGSNGLPIYVSVKGTVFDVSPHASLYSPGGNYHVFAGKDGSKGLGIGSVSPADAVPDYGSLTPPQQATLDGWYTFFVERYNIVGRLQQ